MSQSTESPTTVVKPSSAVCNPKISAIIPTLGRPDALHLCLKTLSQQSLLVSEVLIIHCGNDEETRKVALSPEWYSCGMEVLYYHSDKRNAAYQRNFAVEKARYDLLLLLDDDLELEPAWTYELIKPLIASTPAGATMGCLVNQPMARPTLLWRLYRYLIKGRRGLEPGRLIGAALPNGFPVDAETPIPCEWIGGGCSAIRRDVYESVGGFAPYFTGSSPGEDLDLGYRISRVAKVLYVPTARCIHHQSPINREPRPQHQYLSVLSRFAILYCGMNKGRLRAWLHTAAWAAVQTLSELAALRKGRLPSHFISVCIHRLSALCKCLRWNPLVQSIV